jgi:hypothetical protein
MKKLIFALLLFPAITNAQLGILGGKNIIKTNLSSYALNNYNITYERSFLKKLSFSVGFRYMPKSSLPSAFKDEVEKLIDNKNIKISEFQLGNFAITPELRLYFGVGKMKGFYIAPYARYASFDIQLPVTYDDQNGTNLTVPFTGKINSISGGVLLGVQTQIFKKLVLDIWIVGGHYGSSSGTITAVTPNLGPDKNAIAWKNLQASLDGFNVDGPFKFSGKVTSSTTAEIYETGPWAGVRALGLSLGVRF